MEPNTFRIPISLKVEMDDMFYNFIKPARDDRSLTKVIMNLLRAYYEDDEIRRLVDARNSGEEVLKMLNEEIDRIALEHSKSIAQVTALKYDTESIRSDVTKDTVKNASDTPAATMENILSMLTQLTQRVDMLEGNDTSVPLFAEKVVSEIDIPDFDAELMGTDLTEDPKLSEEIELDSIFDEEPEESEESVEEVYTNLQDDSDIFEAVNKESSITNTEPITVQADILETNTSPVKGVPKSFMKLSSSLTKIKT